MQTDIELSVRSDPRLLAAVRNLVRSYLNQYGFGRDRIDEVVLAVDEACTNAIRHAYHGRKKELLYLAVRTSPAWLEVEVSDNGRPAAWEKIQPREVAPPKLRRLKPHGLGVQLIYSIFDEVEFRVGLDQGNTVLMRLRRPKP